MKSELQRLKDAIPLIQAAVEAAESVQQQISEPLRAWLWQLKDALYQADDVLDELVYLRLQKKWRGTPAEMNMILCVHWYLILSKKLSNLAITPLCLILPSRI